ncbi:MAG: alanine--tRNA ligase [Candidatus Omnitrophica bacterium]|nr:alanine--tRNA ligase [Candidatus Omnitrophota bacterium]
MTTNGIRQTYLDFFKSKGHEAVQSDSLVPKDDPTLLFTGAGMNQFKEKFLGRNITYKRAVSSQKCLRTGDLENVGRTSSHHTFFEMLGNFSFGGYFKKEAIQWAWEFMTYSLKLKADRLWVSVYKDDEEAYNIWKDVVKFPVEKIMKFGEKENFWPSEAPSKGPCGPCGPCSEIFYDYGKDVGCGKPDCTPECDCGRFVEVWNLVFTQFDRQPDGNLKPLPNKNIDTGMGLERIAAVMQGVKTNFEIDIFVPIIGAIEGETGHKVTRSQGYKSCVNAIADHIRAVTFCIADGVMPSNEERGYVVRKLIRRAMSHAQDIGINEPFLYKLVSVVADVMKPQYPEIMERRDDIAQVVKREEGNYLNVLKNQLPIVDEAYKKIANEKKGLEAVISGTNSAFVFSDTFGVPFEVSAASAAKYEIPLDKKRFEILQEEQREKSRSKTKIKSEIFSETFAKKVEALGLNTEFLGYEKAHAEALVLAVLENGEIILDKTPFYGESGGQAGDWGKIETKSGVLEVEDAKRFGQTIVHIGKVLRGKIEKGEKAKVSIDEDVRRKIMRNHTATHLLQAALRKVLGVHVHQTGSLVDQDHLRFDFTHIKKMDPREIAHVEEIVNEAIKKAISVDKEIKGLADAKKEGAVALFGEKYGDKVRVVSIGDVSKELCGGTHVDNTKDIIYFRITSESSIASGIRRIEAMTAEAASEWVKKQAEKELKRSESETKKEEEKKASAVRIREEIEKIDSYIANGKIINNTKVIAEIIKNADMAIVSAIADKIKGKSSSIAVIFAERDGMIASFVVSISDDIIKSKNLHAGKLGSEVAKNLGGSAGGKIDFAQGGFKNLLHKDITLEKTLETIIKKL